MARTMMMDRMEMYMFGMCMVSCARRSVLSVR